jgi:biopolymer transport protein ExbD
MNFDSREWRSLRWIVRFFLIAVLCTLIFARFKIRSQTYGYLAKPVTDECGPNLREDIDRDLVLRVLPDGSTFLNMDQEAPEMLSERITDIFRTRVRKVLFVDVDGQLTFQHVADILDGARRQTPQLRFVIVSSSTKKACEAKWSVAIPGAGGASKSSDSK